MLDVGVDFFLGKRCVVPRPNATGEKVFDCWFDEDAFVGCVALVRRDFVVFCVDGGLDHCGFAPF